MDHTKNVEKAEKIKVGKRYEYWMNCKVCGKKMLRTNFKKHFRAVHESVLCLFCKDGFKQCSSVYDLRNATLMEHYNMLMKEHMMREHKVSQNINFMLFAPTLSTGEMNVIKHCFDHKLPTSEYKEKEMSSSISQVSDIFELISWDEDIFTCIKCGYKKKEKSALLTHILRAHDNFRLKCISCNYKAYEQVKIVRHMRTHHSLDGGPVYFPCSLCEFRSDDTRNLKRHVRENHVEEHQPEMI